MQLFGNLRQSGSPLTEQQRKLTRPPLFLERWFQTRQNLSSLLKCSQPVLPTGSTEPSYDSAISCYRNGVEGDEKEVQGKICQEDGQLNKSASQPVAVKKMMSSEG